VEDDDVVVRDADDGVMVVVERGAKAATDGSKSSIVPLDNFIMQFL
jgi:hypothetical protein